MNIHGRTVLAGQVDSAVGEVHGVGDHARHDEEQQANAIGNGDHGVDITAQLAFAFRIEKRTAPTQCHNGDTNDRPRQPTAHCLLHGGSLGIFNVTIAII